MVIQGLYRVTVAFEGEEDVYLMSSYPSPSTLGVVRVEEAPDFTLQEYADWLDAELENANYHNLVGVFAGIVKVLERTLEPGLAQHVFTQLVEDDTALGQLARL